MAETLEAKKARLRALREARDASLPPQPKPLPKAERMRIKNAKKGRRLLGQLVDAAYAVDKPFGDLIVDTIRKHNR